jgi:hypothetical protein
VSEFQKSNKSFNSSLKVSCSLFVEKIIIDHNIDFIIFGEPPHLPLEYIFHILVENNVIRGIYFNYINQLSLVKNYYFSNLGSFFVKNEVEFKILEQHEVDQLPVTFREMNYYISKPNVTISKNRMSIVLDRGTVEFTMNNDVKESYLNGIKINGDPYQYLIQSGLYGNVSQELQTINKIWEHFETLIEIDFGKNILTNTYKGVSGTIFKLDEGFFVQLRDIASNKFKMLKNINGLQARNEIFEFMRYDITESLYEYLEGPTAEIAKLREEQSNDEKNIIKLTNEIHDFGFLKKQGFGRCMKAMVSLVQSLMLLAYYSLQQLLPPISSVNQQVPNQIGS